MIHYHAVIHRALRYAIKTNLIDVNPADKVDRPRKNGFQPGFYDKDEMNRLFDCVGGLLIEAPVKLAAFYGLRRSSATLLQTHGITLKQIDRRMTIQAQLQVFLKETASAAVPAEPEDLPS